MPRFDRLYERQSEGGPVVFRVPLMSETASGAFDDFRRRLDAFLDSFGHPRERRIAYGNLRHEYSDWQCGPEHTTDVAVIYETPGGSTMQVNVTYDHHTGEFSYLNGDFNEKVVTHSEDDPLHMVAEVVRGIPDRRVERLRAQVEIWYDEGKCQREMFVAMNKLLQSNFLGGSITQRELKLGIKHAIDLRRTSEACGPT